MVKSLFSEELKFWQLTLQLITAHVNNAVIMEVMPLTKIVKSLN